MPSFCKLLLPGRLVTRLKTWLHVLLCEAESFHMLWICKPELYERLHCSLFPLEIVRRIVGLTGKLMTKAKKKGAPHEGGRHPTLWEGDEASSRQCANPTIALSQKHILPLLPSLTEDVLIMRAHVAMPWFISHLTSDDITFALSFSVSRPYVLDYTQVRVLNHCLPHLLNLRAWRHSLTDMIV